jgi:cellulose biosynthesis protein BcsQ
MMRDGLVEVPENALVEERIALGLTAPQLAIATAAVLLAAALNLAPVWAPLKILLILILPGPVALAAVLSIRGEPAYRWLLWAFRHWRSSKVWRAEVLRSADPEGSKRLVSGGVVDHAEDAADQEAAVRGSTTIEPHELGAVESGADNDSAAMRALAAPPTAWVAAKAVPAAAERGDMNGSSPRLRLIEPQNAGARAEEAPRGEAPERLPAIPYVLPGPRLACFVAFAGGVGKTTLAVETATLLASRARYRSADDTTHPLRVVVIDAARLTSAVGLRLGLKPEALSASRGPRDWNNPASVEDAIAASPQLVDVITLPPHSMLGGRARADGGGTMTFGTPAAEAILTAAQRAGYGLVVADLGNLLEEGHEYLIDRADVVLGVVRPTLESIPDVLRLADRLRDAGWGRKLLLVANQCADDTELRSFAHSVNVPLVATIPVTATFSAAADRHTPAWAADPALRASLLPVARALWPLGALDVERHERGAGWQRWLARLRAMAGTGRR